MDKKDSVSQLQWFIQEYIYECDITLCVYRLLNLEINNGYQLKNINQLEDHNLTFVDIEATDDKHDRRFTLKYLSNQLQSHAIFKIIFTDVIHVFFKLNISLFSLSLLIL